MPMLDTDKPCFAGWVHGNSGAWKAHLSHQCINSSQRGLRVHTSSDP